MKIACISPSRVPSRTANSMQAMKVSHALAQLGNEVRLWLPGEESTPWADLCDLYGLENEFGLTWLKSMQFFRRYDFSYSAVKQAKEWGADLVYTWLPQAGLFALERNLAAILEVHDRVRGKLGPWVFSKFCSHPGRKRLVIITHALQKALELEGVIHPASNEVVIAPNGVEWERFAIQPDADEARASLGIPLIPTAAFSGHFYPGRGTGLLFSLAQAMPQIQFLWIGGRKEDIDYWNLKLDEAQVSNVILTGFIDNNRLPLYLAAAEVLMIPFERRIEGSSGGNSADICSPMKLFEYMATGRAILTSDLPVIHEILDESNARFAPPEDLQAWQEALAYLFDHPIIMKALGKSARKDSRQYNWLDRESKTLAGFLDETKNDG
jgi:glycosyltransferase involved in cell wall biosynthesis